MTQKIAELIATNYRSVNKIISEIDRNAATIADNETKIVNLQQSTAILLSAKQLLQQKLLQYQGKFGNINEMLKKEIYLKQELFDMVTKYE